MNTTAIPAILPVLTTSPVATAAEGTTAGTGGGGDAFANLLANEPASTGALPGIENAVEEALAEDLNEPADDEAPWPPLGLETLLAGPASAAEHTAPVVGNVSDNVTLRATPMVANAPAPTPAMAFSTLNASITNGNGSSGQPGNLPLPELVADQQAAASDAVADMLGAQKEQITFQDDHAVTMSGEITSVSAASPFSLTAPIAAKPVPEAPMTADLQGGQFDQEIGEGIEWMLDQKLQSARIRISPDQMGTIEVELKLEGDRVHAHFSSAHAEVRQVLNDSLPRLREMLDAQGLQMGQTGVDAQSRQETGSAFAENAGSDGNKAADGQPSQETVRVLRRGLLDTYA